MPSARSMKYRQAQVKDSVEPKRGALSVAQALAAVAVLVLTSCPMAGAAEPEPAGAGSTHGAESDGSAPIALHGFADVNFRSDWVDSTVSGYSMSRAFSLGQVDLYLTSNLSNHVTFLSETVFKLAASGQQVVEVERIFVKYALADYLKVAAGRTHTALGYWNEAFHHGALLHTTVQRPEILKFGGVMPLHSVGLEVSGRVASGAWEAGYVGNLSNGRGSSFSATQGHTDANRAKGKALKLTLGYERQSGYIAAGPVIYLDMIPPDPSKPSRQHEVDERITGVHLIGGRGPFGLVAEHFWIRHENMGTNLEREHRGGYIVASWRAGDWKPYLGLDRVDFAPGDPVFAGSDADMDRYLAGVRYDLNHVTALKLEYRLEDREAAETHALAFQTAFGF